MNLPKMLTTVSMFILGALQIAAQTLTFTGTISDRNTGSPVEFATVILQESGQWAIADAKGAFTVRNVPAGKTTIKVECLGYATFTKDITISGSSTNLNIQLSPDNLSIDGAVVTAQSNSSSAATSRIMDKTALEHIQMMSVTDISGLMPGGMTSNPVLTNNQFFNIRGNAPEAGNTSFGTAVEVDGVRLSSNAAVGGASALNGTNLTGVTANSIASSNVESVEVISGLPSVEYGDMTSGVVKINTKKGKTPWMVTMSTNPNNKQLSVSKGFGLRLSEAGKSRGVINASGEYTKSISNPLSPYTSYDRKQVSLTYSNLISGGALAETPLRLTAGITGNLGGYDSQSDPDLINNEWYSAKDNLVRGYINLDWLLSKPWITNVEFKASGSYSDKLSQSCSYYSGGTSTPAIHGRQEGYFMGGVSDDIILIAPGYWYNTMAIDNKPVNAKVCMKANWVHSFGKVSSTLKVGGEYTFDKNYGIGEYSDEMETAPSFREYRYCDIPAMNNVAAYAEESMTVPAGSGRILLVAGIRNDNTIINGSEYGTTSSLSPRFNLKYTILDPKLRADRVVKELAVRTSWGSAVKQPSFSILYPEPVYQDTKIFSSTTAADGSTNFGYHILPCAIKYNAALKWQKSNQFELGFDTDIAGNRISIVGFYSRNYNSYYLATGYDESKYTITPTGSSQGLSIPAENRKYTVDRLTGAVTVSDKTGTLPSQVLESDTFTRFTTSTIPANRETPITRYGIEWTVDFKRISAINTTIRWDGSFYNYKSITTDLTPFTPAMETNGKGEHIPYIGWYYGGHTEVNGTMSRNLNTNVTVTTHIPRIRIILSAKVESSIFRWSRSLSERVGSDKARSYKMTKTRNDILDYDGNAPLYNGSNYLVMYPEYYTKYGDPTPRDFMKDILWAKDNDTEMYTSLARLVLPSQYTYTFNDMIISPYFNANFSVTKEIGDLASISFYANNFFDNMGQVHNSRTDSYVSVSSYIPGFYYGITLRLKF